MSESYESSQLVLGLPAPAFCCLIQHLVASGSSNLKELLTCCKTARSLVFQHAPYLRLLLGSKQTIDPYLNPARHKKSGTLSVRVCDALKSRTSDLALKLDLADMEKGQAEKEVIDLFVKGGAALRTCTMLGFTASKGRSSYHSCPDLASWMHLVPMHCPRMRTLMLSHVSISHAGVFAALASCTQLTTLCIGPGISLPQAVMSQLHLMCVWLPHVHALSLGGSELLPVVGSLRGQLTSVSMGSDDTSAAWPVAAVSLLTSDALTDVLLGFLQKIPSLRDVSVASLSLGTSHPAPGGHGGRGRARGTSHPAAAAPSTSSASRPSAPSIPATWERLTLTGPVSSAQLVIVLQPHLKRLRLRAVQLPVTSGAAASSGSVLALAETLADAQRAARIEWALGAPALLIQRDGHTPPTARTFAPAPSGTQAISSLGSLAPLQPFVQVLHLHLETTKPEQQRSPYHTAATAAAPRELGPAELQALATSVGGVLHRLHLHIAGVSEEGWAWLAHELPRRMPALRHLLLHGLESLDPMALALFAAAAPQPLFLTIASDKKAVLDVAQRVERNMSAFGVSSRVAFATATASAAAGQERVAGRTVGGWYEDLQDNRSYMQQMATTLLDVMPLYTPPPSTDFHDDYECRSHGSDNSYDDYYDDYDDRYPGFVL